MNASQRPAASEVNAGLATRMEDLATALIGAAPSSRTRAELRFRSRGSLAVVVSGSNRGSWFDHEVGVGGGPLDLVMHLRGCDFCDAMDWATRWMGGTIATDAPAPRHHAAPDDHAAWSVDLARRLWAEGVPPADTAIETYLRSRGLELPQDAPLRFHPGAWRNRENGPPGAAMLALMTDPAAAGPVGLHVTYLRPDGRGKAEGERPKVMLGHAGTIRLEPDAEVTAGLGIAEGIETALSVSQGFGWRPVWAATSAGGIARFPVLGGIEALTIFADGDPPGQAAACTCRDRWCAAGREARILTAPPRRDFNDLAARAA